MRYYISDLHFFHDGVNQNMDHRGFSSVEGMNNYMIDKWNKKVRRKDEVVILGDFSVEKGPKTNEILHSLNGHKYLIQGNHDKFLRDKQFDAALFKWIKPYAEINDNNRKVVLCHYPIMCYNGQYRKTREGNPRTYMLYGHVHNTFDETLVQRYQEQARELSCELYGQEGPQRIPCNMINCFCMRSDYTPLSLDEWITLQYAP